MLKNSFSLKGAIFDLDGTLFVSPYNWKEIKRRLGVREGLILDHLNSLEEPERSRKFKLLEKMEREATSKGKVAEGAKELINFLKDRNVKIGVLTNNSRELAKKLISKIKIPLDVLVTRDDGVYKPYPEAMNRALSLLGLKSEECIYVGDNVLDIKAAEPFTFRNVFIIDKVISEEAKKEYKNKVVFVNSLFEVIEFLDGKII